MLNNKGQSLVLFVLVFPIIFLILVFVVDIGKMVLLRQELDNINYLAIDFGLDKLNNEEKINDFIIKNKKDIDKIQVKNIDNKLYILLEDTSDKSFFLLDDLDVFIVKSSYVGYFDEDNKKIIERVK